MNEPQNGVGPHPLPLPVEPYFDLELLLNGDHRNVIDKYRYWKVAAIKEDLDASRLPLEIAVENLSRDFNMGTIIRNANAFNIGVVHIIGRRQWNKRGAMVTDVYMNIEYHQNVEAFTAAMRVKNKKIIAIDITDTSIPIDSVDLPKDVVMVFGAEGPGLSRELQDVADLVTHIEQFGSTRSVNVGVASGIAMYAWLQKYALTR